jgi:hypothetical protein
MLIFRGSRGLLYSIPKVRGKKNSFKDMKLRMELLGKGVK